MPKKQTKQSEILDSMHNIWLAGLGSLHLAEQEGSRWFHTLVEKGKEMEGRLDEPVGKASEAVRGTVKNFKRRAGTTVETVESAIDARVTSVLGRLGVPTRDEIATLTRRVEELTRKIHLSPSSKRKRKPTKKASGPVRRKVSAKKTARRKTKRKAR